MPVPAALPWAVAGGRCGRDVGTVGPHRVGPGARRAGRAGRTTDSWAAAATEALPMTRIVGSPSSQAAEATSASASA